MVGHMSRVAEGMARAEAVDSVNGVSLGERAMNVGSGVPVVRRHSFTIGGKPRQVFRFCCSVNFRAVCAVFCPFVLIVCLTSVRFYAAFVFPLCADSIAMSLMPLRGTLNRNVRCPHANIAVENYTITVRNYTTNVGSNYVSF